MDAIGKRIAKLRIDKGMTQAELAAKLYTSRAVVAKWENDEKRSIPNEHLISMADMFEVTTDYLLGRTKARKPANINIVDKYGLSEKALSKLKHYLLKQKKNSITLVINTLLEEGNTLYSIARYLYYNLEGETRYDGMVPYRLVYQYNDYDPNEFWKESTSPSVDVNVNVEAINNDMCKRMIMLEIQENLVRLLEHENQIEHFHDG